MKGEIINYLVALVLSVLIFWGSSCSEVKEPKVDSASFLYGTWKWNGELYEITFLEGGQALWNYNDDRGTKKTPYTYDSTTSIIVFTSYHESYQVLNVKSTEIQILSLWDNEREVWYKIETK